MTTEKNLAAFMDRLYERVRTDPKASRRDTQRVAFVAVRPLVAAALAAGHTMKATWEVLQAEGTLAMSYQTFRSYCRRSGLVAAATDRSQRFEQGSTTQKNRIYH